MLFVPTTLSPGERPLPSPWFWCQKHTVRESGRCLLHHCFGAENTALTWYTKLPCPDLAFLAPAPVPAAPGTGQEGGISHLSTRPYHQAAMVDHSRVDPAAGLQRVFRHQSHGR